MTRFSSLAALLGAGVLGVGILTACSYCFCYPGVFPMEGATGVDPDVVMVVESDWRWSPEELAIGGVVELLGPDGLVPVEVSRVESSDLVIEVRPVASLPEGAYTLLLRHHSALEDSTAGHYVGDFGPSNDSDSHFSVGGQPSFIDWIPASENHGALVFSEAIDAASFEGRVFVDGEPVTPVSGNEEGTVWIVDLAEDQGEAENALALGPGITTVSGVSLPEDGDTEFFGSLERYLGQTWCDC